MHMYKARRTEYPSGTEGLTIGQIAHLTGINAKAIRYYESIGLLPRPPRSANHYRRYSMVDVSRLKLLQRIRLSGIPLSAAKSLLADVSDARCVEVRQALLSLVKERLAALDREIAELQSFRVEVEHYQHALIDCRPDENELFSACLDMACMDFSCETIDGTYQEETNETSCNV